jgi:L-aminopeptidase/D-esterase-like protein
VRSGGRRPQGAADAVAAGFFSQNGNGEMTGTASRLVDYAGTGYTVGVFLQANFGSREELTLGGRPLGELLADDSPMAQHFAMPAGAGSVIAIVATDAPLIPPQCTAMARRVTLGLARTGTAGSHFSGDLFLAFSTANPGGITPGPPSAPARRGGMTSSPSSRGASWTRFSPPWCRRWRRPSPTR